MDNNTYRNKSYNLIRQAKNSIFLKLLQILKTLKLYGNITVCKQKSTTPENALPDEIEINGQQYTHAQEIAYKLNTCVYFASISDFLYANEVISCAPDVTKLQALIRFKIPNEIFFSIPNITADQVSEFIDRLNSAIGLYGIGPRILKLANNILSSSITALIKQK